MKITDVTQKYTENILKKNDLTSYEKNSPELFEHYFKYWALKNFFHKTLKTENEVKEKVDLIKSRLGFIEQKLINFGFDISDLKIILFVGQNCTNGHAFKKDGEFVVWLPVEAYETPEEVDIFVIHEIIHAFHYKQNFDFYFNTKKEKKNVGREIIVEGLATYLTSKILNISDEKALWSDFLSEEELKKWISSCNQNKKELRKFVLDNFDSSNEDIQIFLANDSNDIYKYRSGYFVGLELIKSIVKNNNIPDKDLLSLDRKNFEKKIKQELNR
ncbi:hypothetical protein KKG48_01730 [Patescibacteria group bacterium]|nr:hypothetical protein [Patescibacteria group bacterium]MCG2694901.1 DUF2268 domain-containing putative Zn-dependent protease [Candidatus Parcubacteria bacterium]